MRKLVAAGCFAVVAMLSLAGCGLGALGTLTTSVSTDTVITPKLVEQVHYTFEAYQAIVINYDKLRPCTASEQGFPAQPCSKNSVVSALTAANNKAQTAVTTFDDWWTNYPTLNALSVIQGVKSAVNAFQTSLLTSSIPIPKDPNIVTFQ